MNENTILNSQNEIGLVDKDLEQILHAILYCKWLSVKDTKYDLLNLLAKLAYTSGFDVEITEQTLYLQFDGQTVLQRDVRWSGLNS